MITLLILVPLFVGAYLATRPAAPREQASEELRWYCPDCPRHYRTRELLRLHDQATHDELAQLRAKQWWHKTRAVREWRRTLEIERKEG